MIRYSLSRRRFLMLGGGALAAGLLGQAQAQPETIRIGFVLPRQAGVTSRLLDTQELAGEAAYMGAIMGEEDFGVTEKSGTLEVLISSAPDAASAQRAAERLATSEGVHALVGGFGHEQALVLSAVAENHKVLFFNIGAPSDALRSVCNRYTFHVEASAAMYLSALTSWFTHEGFRRWFFVCPLADDTLYRQARRAVQTQVGAVEVGRAIVPKAPLYSEVVAAIERTEPEVVLLLLDWRSQLDFLGYYEAAGLESAVSGFPYPVTQTRDFLLAARDVTSKRVSDYRAALWEARLEPHGARVLNQRFLERWGKPMDPSAWAAYQSLRILYEAVSSVETLNSDKLIAYLESPRARFDVQKGSVLSFRPSDHQLYQPLYVIRENPASTTPWDVAELAGELPALDSSAVDSAKHLDHLDDRGSHCQF